MTLSALGIFSAAGAGGVQGDYELIQTTILGSSQASITFSNLGDYASTYKHLQIRSVGRTDRAGAADDPAVLRLNGDTGANYNFHLLLGNGSSVYSGTDAYAFVYAGSTATANSFGTIIFDLLDAYSTTKNKTVRKAGGIATSGANFISLSSMLWRNTAAVTSFTIVSITGSNLVAGSRFSLYGIRG